MYHFSVEKGAADNSCKKNSDALRSLPGCLLSLIIVVQTAWNSRKHKNAYYFKEVLLKKFFGSHNSSAASVVPLTD